MKSCSFPKGTVLLDGTMIPLGISIDVTTKLIIGSSPQNIVDSMIPKGVILPPGSVLQAGFKFITGSVLPIGTVFTKGSILDNETVIESPPPGDGDNSFYSLFYYYNKLNPLDTNQSYFYTNQNKTLYRPPTIFSYLHFLIEYYNKMIELKNKITLKINKMFENFKLTTKSSSYATVIGYSYPVLSSINTFEQLITNIIKNDTNFLPIMEAEQKAIKEVYDKNMKIFNITNFEQNINIINSYLYLYY
jgi:hypothetical protein